MANELTVKMDNFAMKYVETGNASLAYRHAYEAEDMLPGTVWAEASKLVKNPLVTIRVKELRELAQEMVLVSVGTITAELEEARQLALTRAEGASAAVSASMGKAKLHGLITDKSEIGNKDGLPFETKDSSAMESARKIAFILARAANTKPKANKE